MVVFMFNSVILNYVILGAGIIPFSKINNELVFLLGKDYAHNKWSDFGGKGNKGETKLEVALREGYEETNGMLGNENDIYNKIKKTNLPIIKTDDNRHSCYLLYIDYNKELPIYMMNNFNFIKKNIPNLVVHPNGYYEKSEVAWFSIEDLKNSSDIREYFVDIVWKLDKKYINLLNTYD
tara:strand:+ start:910 stop:1446 length:537 start_codon:yes stop_codon:yes gene_type:complete